MSEIYYLKIYRNFNTFFLSELLIKSKKLSKTTGKWSRNSIENCGEDFFFKTGITSLINFNPFKFKIVYSETVMKIPRMAPDFNL